MFKKTEKPIPRVEDVLAAFTKTIDELQAVEGARIEELRKIEEEQAALEVRRLFATQQSESASAIRSNLANLLLNPVKELTVG